MATLVTFHAHPDDEAIATGGVMAKAAADGHRVVAVFATRGERGEVADGFLAEAEELWQRRVAETEAAAAILGVHRVVFLGYGDSGMEAGPDGFPPGCFAAADVEEAAARLAAVLDEEGADILTAYDDYGVYGHPDHVQVHRVGVRAAELAGTPKVYENTYDRDHIKILREVALATDVEIPEFDELFGRPAADITTAVDVSPWLDTKRAAMAAHASQIPEDSFFLALAPDLFAAGFGTEWFILRGAPPGTREADLFEGV